MANKWQGTVTLMGRSMFDETTVLVAEVALTNAVGTTITTLQSAGPIDFRIDNLLLTNTDTIIHAVDVYAVHSSVNYLLGSVNVPIGAGVNGVANVDAVSLIVAAGQAGLLGGSTVGLAIANEVAAGAGHQVTAVAIGGYF